MWRPPSRKHASARQWELKPVEFSFGDGAMGPRSTFPGIRDREAGPHRDIALRRGETFKPDPGPTG